MESLISFHGKRAGFLDKVDPSVLGLIYSFFEP